MESKSLKTLQLLEAIAEDKPTSQRELSDSLQISLGLVNSFIKRLVKKGYCKVTTIPKNRVKYILTPAGAMEKTRLTYEYISISYNYFKRARNRLQGLYDELQHQGKTRIVFYGTGEVADIAYLSMTGTDLDLVDVIDPEKVGQQFGRHVIRSCANINREDFDILLVTAVGEHAAILSLMEHAGVPANKIKFF
ncbi:winged helix-turn-helix transcriptional regulator [Desulfosarcina sp.]|uniref:winged helix-turn-helix transcriptional regulator n=1 Tax=Desulfosarcina sp. TaxID=2027861 RepID=UPI00397061FB